MVEMAHDQFDGGQPRGKPQKMEQSQGIHPSGYAHKNSVSRRKEPPPHDVVRKVAREPEVPVQ
jgi:hypothetical protein